MKYSFLLLLTLIPLISFTQIITVGDSGDYPTLSATESVLTPGDTVLLLEQIFDDGTQFLNDVQGTAEAPIVIMAAPGQEALFRGGTEGIHLINCKYIELNGIIIEQQTGNGINIDDGGDYSTPASHITIRNCIFRDMAANGNNDLLKLSGLDSFLVENCTFTNGGDGGSGVDMVGCHWGTIQDCVFDDAGVSGIQNKGGTQYITIRRNVFQNMSQRALNLGGSTGLQFFRPPLPDPIENAFEAADIDVFSNVFINNWAPIAYVGAINVVVRNNTFYSPDNWVIRILQETTVDGFVACQDNEFSNNIVYLDNDLTEANIGPNTLPESFVFTNNLWFNASSDNWAPILPVADPNQLIIDPLFNDAGASDFSLQEESPAIGAGASFSAPVTDFTDQIFATPPSIGAFAGNPVPITSNHSPAENGLHTTIYPNPAQNRTTLEWDFGSAEIRLLDALGRCLQVYSKAESPFQLSWQDLAAGAYWVRWHDLDSSNVIFRKLVVVKN